MDFTVKNRFLKNVHKGLGFINGINDGLKIKIRCLAVTGRADVRGLTYLDHTYS